jgi:hypothetical protein
MSRSHPSGQPPINRLRTAPAPSPLPPKRRRRLILLVGALLAGLFLVLLAYWGEPAPPPPSPRAENRAPAPVDCSRYPFKHHSGKLKDLLPAYKKRSQMAGVKPITDAKALDQHLAKGAIGLVPVESTAAFWVAPMAHGRPYLTPAAKQVLHAIADDFKGRIARTDLAGARIKVTSLFRTRQDQRNLGRGNLNATRDADAPHTHGTSMDLSYMRFVDKDGKELPLAGCQQVFLAETLAEVIAGHRARDKQLFATREARQACYHLSVCR